MQKQAPSIVRIFVAAGFALSCFALLLFLWIAFGGPVPLKPKSYRITAYFPEATQLAVESDVRIGGVSVGKVKSVELAPEDVRIGGRDLSAAVIEIDPEFAPISSDAKAILRQKTLLGETYVELTSGNEPAGEVASVSLGDAVEGAPPEGTVTALEEDGTLGVGQTEEATQIDEIFNGFDEETRTSFQRWQASSAVAIEDRGQDLNDAFGNLAPFLTDATDVLEVLDAQETALRGVIRDTGTVFDAFSERGDALAGAIVGSRNTFAGLASEERALAEVFQVLPTFQRETKLTLERLDRFQVNAQPLIRDLIPIARDLSPTLRDVRILAPDLRDLFIDLEELEHVSQEGLPALRDFLDGLAPVLDRLDPFLANLNPVIKYLGLNRKTVTDFLGGPGAGFSGRVLGEPGDPAPRHYLRQLSIVSPETLSLYPNRIATNRGHGYIRDGVLNGYEASVSGIFPNFDCKNTDYSAAGTGGDETDEQELRLGEPNPHSDVNSGNPAGPSFAACFIGDPFPDLFGGDRAPQVFRDP
jgi:phospholipid/cholesterol/gamma-HCH transport system substrate-binding protein